jgi:hypothetical protein
VRRSQRRRRGIEDGAVAPQASIERRGRDRPRGPRGLAPARQRVEVTLHVAPRGTRWQQRRESLVERERPALAPGPGAGVRRRAQRGGVGRVERRIVLGRGHEQEGALDRRDAGLGGAGQEARLGARELRLDHPASRFRRSVDGAPSRSSSAVRAAKAPGATGTAITGPSAAGPAGVRGPRPDQVGKRPGPGRARRARAGGRVASTRSIHACPGRARADFGAGPGCALVDSR